MVRTDAGYRVSPAIVIANVDREIENFVWSYENSGLGVTERTELGLIARVRFNFWTTID